jgi:hypothetical protein
MERPKFTHEIDRTRDKIYFYRDKEFIFSITSIELIDLSRELENAAFSWCRFWNKHLDHYLRADARPKEGKDGDLKDDGGGNCSGPQEPAEGMGHGA